MPTLMLAWTLCGAPPAPRAVSPPWLPTVTVRASDGGVWILTLKWRTPEPRPPLRPPPHVRFEPPGVRAGAATLPPAVERALDDQEFAARREARCR